MGQWEREMGQWGGELGTCAGRYRKCRVSRGSHLGERGGRNLTFNVANFPWATRVEHIENC